jgi:phytoene dehydrogenase-like protein
VRLVSRPTASYTPVVRDGRAGGLYVERVEGEATRASFRALTGADDEYDAWRAFYAEVGALAEAVAPTLLDPLPRESLIRERVPAEIWRDVVERPLGEAIERRFSDDTVRGVVATDALIGTFASLHDPTLVQNRCFLYHLIGNGTGEWRVPVGGMGAVTDALAKAAVDAGAEIVTDAEVSSIRPGADGAEVAWARTAGAIAPFAQSPAPESPANGAIARYVLSGVAPWTLAHLLDRPAPTKPEGAQLKINLLLARLPRLRSGADPREAFAGTLHLAEDYSQLEAAHDAAEAGRVPDPMPGEVYCHSLTDPSILGDVPAGTHTLTYFGLHTPARLFESDPEGAKQAAVRSALAALDAHLAEPIADCVARDGNGDPCIEAKIPQDVERDLAMPGGHIFHGDLGWPWAPDGAALDTPGAQWGVATDVPSVLLAGSGSQRGGAVSALGGLHAARAVLESG